MNKSPVADKSKTAPFCKSTFLEAISIRFSTKFAFNGASFLPPVCVFKNGILKLLAEIEVLLAAVTVTDSLPSSLMVPKGADSTPFCTILSALNTRAPPADNTGFAAVPLLLMVILLPSPNASNLSSSATVSSKKAVFG